MQPSISKLKGSSSAPTCHPQPRSYGLPTEGPTGVHTGTQHLGHPACCTPALLGTASMCWKTAWHQLPALCTTHTLLGLTADPSWRQGDVPAEMQCTVVH